MLIDLLGFGKGRMMSDMLQDAINSYFENHWEDVIADLDVLVRIASVEKLDEGTEKAPYGPGPRAALTAVLEIAECMGFETCDCEGRIGYADMPGESETQIGIIGHVDVVPAGPGWTFPPFEVSRKEGYLIGRGVADDKGPVVVALHALKFWRDRLDTEGRRFPYTVRFLFGANEETNMKDVVYYREHYPDPAFLFTPDAEFPVCYGESGICSGTLSSAPIGGGSVVELEGGVAVNAVPGSFGTGIGGGQYGGGGMVAINGGAVTATNVLNTNGIGAGANGASTTVTLNWTEDTKDTMSVISYRGYSGTVKLDRPFEDKSSGTVFYRTANADKSKLSGKTLTPFTKLFAGHSLTLNGDIGVNFFLNLTDEQAAKTTVSFRWFNKTHNDVPVEAVEGRPGIYRTSCPVAVAEMTYEITATVTIDNAIQEETDRYKVVSYADRLSTLVKTMLDYGAKAQLRFDRDKNNPANGGEDFFTDPVTIENNADDMTAELEACGLSYVGSSVIYLSQTTLRHYYKITEPDKFTEEVRNGITFDGKAAAYGERDGMIYFDKKDIAAPQLDTEYVIRINGNDYHYAVLDYIARAYNDESASPIEKELAAAVCRYHAAADAYFGN